MPRSASESVVYTLETDARRPPGSDARSVVYQECGECAEPPALRATMFWRELDWKRSCGREIGAVEKEEEKMSARALRALDDR
ncbi:hypothetical protein NDU88_001149 [Pleurodeles waltl]|uniref:Uncharacterized protein n=1 Tax=Pleurodeles waltl TaxID=8319 RepID=A0AAV7UTW2_PLEWA|nr:hypothetical protein NDU88_001149 [Pleurodeles waltl]